MAIWLIVLLSLLGVVVLFLVGRSIAQRGSKGAARAASQMEESCIKRGKTPTISTDAKGNKFVVCD